MPKPRTVRAAACAAVASLVLATSALAAASSDTTIAVAPRIELGAPTPSPVAFPGITRVHEDEPLPRGWVVVRRDVRITRGGEVAFAAFRMTCPKGKTWRSGTDDGDILASVLDRDPRARKRSVLVMARFTTREVRAGETASGTIYALCR
jgi:hypothetical protein